MVKLLTIVAGILTASPALTAARSPKQPAQENPVLGTTTSQGCFNSLGDSLTHGKAKDVKMLMLSAGGCADACMKLNKPAMALGPNACYCGDTYPPKDALTSDDKCDYACPGYAMEACGGLEDAYSVYNTGLEVNVKYDGGKDDSSDNKDDDKTTTTTQSATNAEASSSGTTTAASDESTATTDAISDDSTATTASSAVTSSDATSVESAAASETSDPPSMGTGKSGSIPFALAVAGLAALL